MNKKIKAALITFLIVLFIVLLSYAVIKHNTIVFYILMSIITIAFIIFLYNALLTIIRD
jgi:hypothetical protein